MKLRIAEPAWRDFVAGLNNDSDLETAGIILAEIVPGTDALVATRLMIVPPDGYLIRRKDQLRIDPLALNRMVRPARDLGLSIITVHTHPGAQDPWFSLADDRGDSRLMPSFFNQTPGPHGSMVVAGGSGDVIGRSWNQDGGPSGLDLRLVGRTLGFGTRLEPPAGDKSQEWFDRQRLALGEHGHQFLRRLHVGVVGLGGTGSAVAMQLAHLGVGALTLVDADLVEASNVSRVLGAVQADAGKSAKVAVAARYIEALGVGTRIRALGRHLTAATTCPELGSCDIIFSCVDRHTPRALLNRIAYEHLIPVIDMGSAFRVDETGRVVASAGRVVVVGPGRPCLSCWGHIDPLRLRVESLSTEDRAKEAAEGYIEGADVPQPSVVAFNTMLAGAAVVELLRMVTAFAGADDPPLRLSFDFETGVVRRNRLSAGTGCRVCSRNAHQMVSNSETPSSRES